MLFRSLGFCFGQRAGVFPNQLKQCFVHLGWCLGIVEQSLDTLSLCLVTPRGVSVFGETELGGLDICDVTEADRYVNVKEGGVGV